MLKNKIIFTIFSVVVVIASSVIQAAFASNEEKAALFPSGVDTEKAGDDSTNDDASGVGVYGSYLSSQFSRSTGDVDSAIKSLQSVYKKNPQNIEIANQLMGLYLLGGHVDKAMEIALSISKDNPKESISALMLSLKAIKNKDAISASKILDKMSEEEGGQLWLPLISAWLDVEQHKLLKPLMMEELSAEVGRAAPVVNYHLALINAQAGFTKAATENFKQAVEDPSHPPSRVIEMLVQFYEKNNSPEALKPFVTAYRQKNSNVNVFKTKSYSINNMQDGAAEVLLTMGSIMLAADVTQDAALYLQLALYLKPDMELATVALAQAYSELQQYGIANELLAKISPTSQLHSHAQLYAAINLGRLKKFDEAIAKLDEIIAKLPNNLDAYMAKGDLLRNQERFSDAITVYGEALGTLKVISEQHWSIFFAIGTCFDKLGNWTEAERNLRRSIELSPIQPDVLNYLGYSLLMRGENLANAKEFIEKAITKRPSDPQIMDSMGWALYLSGDYKQSVLYLERAVSLLPADATVNEHLGDLYWRLGRKTEARFQWDRSLIYVKDNNVSQELQNKIKSGLPDIVSSDVTEKKNKNTTIKTAVVE